MDVRWKKYAGNAEQGELLLVELKVDDKRLSGLPEDKELYEVVLFSCLCNSEIFSTEFL